MYTEVVVYGLWAVVPVLFAVLAVRPVSAKELSRFTNRYGLERNPEIDTAAARAVRRGRTGRLAGAALGLSLYPVLFALGWTIPNHSFDFGIIGYLLGAFVTALVPSAPRAKARRASLVPRRAGDYLPRTALVMPTIAAAVSAVAVITYLLEPRRALSSWNGSTSGLGIAAVAAAATFIAVRVVVARPQPLTTPGLDAVDDAVRTQAVHTLAASGISVALFGTAACLFEMGAYASPEWLRLVGVFSGLAALAGSLMAWTFRSAPWRVQRTMQ